MHLNQVINSGCFMVVVLVHVVGFAPGPVPGPGNDGSDGGLELQWNYGLEPKRKKLKEQDFLENNSQISSIDFLQARSVSTGLGLSLDNTRASSSGDSALLSLISDDIDSELQRQDAEVDKFLKIQVGIFLKITALFKCKLSIPVAIFVGLFASFILLQFFVISLHFI